MKKTFLTMAIAAIALCGFSASAQTKDNCKATTCDKSTCVKGQRPCRDAVAFEGITLTESQQTALKQLNADRTAKREQARKARADRQKQRRMDDSTFRAQRRNDRADYLKSVKNILTPEQYVVFLENIVIDQPQGKRQFVGPRHGAAKPDGRMARGDRHGKDHQHKGSPKAQKTNASLSK